MSASMSLPSGSEVFTFLTARTDSGHVLDQAAIEEEPLETAGVDGVRWRTLRLAHRPFQIQTVTGCASFTDAVISAKNYLKAKGKNCSYTNSAGGVSYNYQNLHILDVAPVPTVGPVVGGGASSGLTAHVVTVWTVIPTSFSEADRVVAS
jgi:hypothetical protein